MFLPSLWVIRLALNAVLMTVELFGDGVLVPDWNIPAFALLDNLTHGLIAALSWMIVVTDRGQSFRQCLLEVMLCGAIGSLMDLDHFVEAGSWHLKDARNLSRRSFLHCTSTVLVTWTLLMAASHVTPFGALLARAAWILLLAALSHHVRDSIRRGLWLRPFGSTPPTAYWLYLVATGVMPHLVRIVLTWKRPAESAPLVTEHHV